MINSLTLATVHSPKLGQLGAFGYCTGSPSICSSSKLGYDLTKLTAWLSNRQSTNADGIFDSVSDGVAKSLTAVTKGFILHPIAAAFAFLAMIVACLSDKIGYLFATILSLLAFLSSLAVMIIDFVAFALVKNHVGDAGGRVTYGTGTWLTLVATILLLIANLTALVSCCCGRSSKHKRRAEEARLANERANGYNGTEKRKFWQRGPRAGAVGTHHNDGLYDDHHTTANPYGNTATGPYDNTGAYNNTGAYDHTGVDGTPVGGKRHFWNRGTHAV